MYPESLEWYYNRYKNTKYNFQCNVDYFTETPILETQNPGDGRVYWLSIEDQPISPKLKAKEMKIYLDALTEQFLWEDNNENN